jgi:tetratricopeptide (TPR) repeat protein
MSPEALVEYRFGSFLVGVVLLLAVGFFTMFPQLKPDWIQIHAGSGRAPARAGSFRSRNASWTPDPKSAEACFDRGIAHLENEQWDEAIEEFTEVVRLEPKNAEAYYNRGLAWEGKKEWHKAVSDFNAFLRLEPNDPDGYMSRSEALVNLGQSAAAIADLDSVLRLTPDDVEVYCIRGKLREDAGEYRLALFDYNLAAQRQPDDATVLNYLAWLLATAPDAQLRDGHRALTAALRAVEIENAKEWDTIDTLAAAFAETGNFSQAIRSETEALRRAPPEEHGDLQARLELYQARKPYRLPESGK